MNRTRESAIRNQNALRAQIEEERQKADKERYDALPPLEKIRLILNHPLQYIRSQKERLEEFRQNMIEKPFLDFMDSWGEKMILLEYKLHVLKPTLLNLDLCYNGDQTPSKTMSYIDKQITELTYSMITNKPWEHNSTDAMANVIRANKASALADAILFLQEYVLPSLKSAIEIEVSL